MNALIIFEIPIDSERALLIEGLTNAGFARSWTYGTNNEYVFHLPHNVMWKLNVTIEEARIQFDTVLRQINTRRGSPITVNGFLIVPSFPWIGFSPT